MNKFPRPIRRRGRVTGWIKKTLFRRAGARPTPHELEVIRALLGAGKAARRIIRQVAESDEVRRSSDRFGYLLGLAETREDLLIELDHDVTSDWQPARNALSGELLEFRISVGVGGFFEALEGRPRNGDWPDKWQISEEDLRRFRPLTLLERTSCDALLEWLGERAKTLRAVQLKCRAPADHSRIRELEQREGGRLPADFAELLYRSDGLTVGGVDIHGTRDLFVTELIGEPWWVVASQRGEVFVVRHREAASGRYVRIERGQDDPREGDVLGSTATELVAGLASNDG